MRANAAICALSLSLGCGVSNDQGLSFDFEQEHPCVQLHKAVRAVEVDYPDVQLRHRCRVEEDGVERCGWAVSAGEIWISSRSLDFSDAVSQVRGHHVEGSDCPTHIDAEALAYVFDDVRVRWRCVDDGAGGCDHGWGVWIDGAWVVQRTYPIEGAVAEAARLSGIPSAWDADAGAP